MISLSGQRGVGRLIRTLLADPLGQEQSWENLLEDGDAEDARALLIRYAQRGYMWVLVFDI